MRGNTGTGPLKALDEKSLAAGGQRWRFIPLHNRLASASARPVSLPSLQFDTNLTDLQPDDTFGSHFAEALSATSESNITATFSHYQQQVRPLSHSLPLIYRNRRRLVTLTLEALQSSARNAAEATPPLATCLTALSKDLGPQEFYPFFAQVVDAFASVLQIGRDQKQSKSGNLTRPSTYSQFWDPEVSMLPLFAALAEITKSCLHCLASDPRQTLHDLLPLVGNSHYRVREMTAESCLGYLLRKTRDLSVLKQLTRHLLEISASAEVATERETDLLDGLGAALFEAIRLPSGQLQTRATKILVFALQRLDEVYPRGITQIIGNASEAEERMLQVISICLSRLCRHLTNPVDIRTIVFLLLKAGEDAKEQARAAQIGDVAFLLRKWLEHRGSRTLSLIDGAALQKCLITLSDWVRCFVPEPRVTYECLGGLCAILSTSSEESMRQASSRALSSASATVSSSTRVESILCAMAIILKAQSSHQNLIDASITQGYAKLCEQLAKLSEVELFTNPAVLVSTIALDRALTFLSYLNESETKTSSQRTNSFRVPTLEAQLISVLSHPHVASLRDLRDQRCCQLVRTGLRYLSIVQVSNGQNIFGNLIASQGITLEDSAWLLESFCLQVNGRIGHIPPSLMESITVVVDRLLESLEKSDASSSGIAALQKYIRLFPLEAKKILYGRSQATEDYLATLSANLSSRDGAVRLRTADLLSSISGLFTCNEIVVERTEDDEIHLRGGSQGKIERLRSLLAAQDACSSGFFETLRYVCNALRSLSLIDEALRVLREIARMIRGLAKVSRVVVIASLHFSIGLLRTPFKMLWNCAGDVWSAAAGHMSEDAMVAMSLHMSKAEHSLLSKRCVSPEESVDNEDENLDAALEDAELPEKGAESAAKRRIGVSNCDQQSLLSRRCPKRPRADSRSAVAECRTSHVPKRKQANDRGASLRQWDCKEWRRNCAECSDWDTSATRNGERNETMVGVLEGQTDDLTFLREVLRVLSKDPHRVVPFRSQIISSYLRLDPTLFSRRVGNSLASSFAVLIEKLGGLKRGDRGDFEESLRQRLLSDVTRSCPPLQVVSLRCLCASRSNALKRHRESFIRLVEDSSFRDELTAVTGTLLPKLCFDETGNALDGDSDFVLDVLLRICFSKMTGKAARTDSHRAAVLSFIISRLPVMIALPRIITLVLAPIADIIDEVELTIRDQDTVVDRRGFPGLNVQMGLLTSIESIMKQCHRFLDPSSWIKIGTGCFVLLQNAITGTSAKNIRSRSLRILAHMCRARGEETSFLILPVLRVIRSSTFDVDRTIADRGVPGLLHFVASVYDTSLRDVQKWISLKEQWAVIWSLHLLKQENAELETVEVSLSVAEGLTTLLLGDSVASLEEQDDQLLVSSSYSNVASVLLSSLRALLRRLVDDALRDRNRRKMWSPVFDRALQTVERMVAAPSLKSEDLVALSEGLVVYLENTASFASSSERTLGVLSAMSKQLCARNRLEDNEKAKSHMHQMRSSVLRLMSLLGNVQIVSQPKAYLELCSLLANLDAPDLNVVAAHLEAMIAMKPSQLDSPDLDKRIDSLNGVIRAFKDALEAPENAQNHTMKEVFLSIDGDSKCESRRVVCDADAITALVYGCIASVMFNDVAVRGTSSYALQVMGRWSAVSDSKSAKTCQQRMFRLLLEAVAAARTGVVRREYTRALAELVRRSACIRETNEWSGYSMFSLLKDICRPDDLDSDFFENIVHLQAHRRGRALRQIQKDVLDADMKTVKNEGMKYEAYTAFASMFSLPLGMQIALELSEDGAQRRVSRHAESRESAEKDIAVWAVAVVGASARWLRWSELKPFICDLLRRLKHCDSEKRADTLYKLLVAVVEAFPDLEGSGKDSNVTVKEFLVGSLLPTMLNHISAGGVEGDLVDVTENVTRARGERENGRPAPCIFRAPVASAVAHLLTRLPDSEVEAVIPRLVTPLANALRSRKTAIRDSAKKALTSVVLTLGLRYLPYVLRQVLSNLSQGFRKDACVYVIHSILVGIRDSAQKVSLSGGGDALAIDEAAETVAVHLSEELQRGTSVTTNNFEDPNASTFLQKQASLRAGRAFDCAEMLAEYVTFDRSARILLRPFQNILRSTSSSKLISRIENILQRMITGFTKNRSMRPADALKICYELISAPSGQQTCQSIENPEQAAAASVQGKQLMSKTTKKDCSILTFGMQLLCNLVSRNAVLFGGTSCASRELQAMLGPFLPLIVGAMQSKHDPLTIVALRAAQKLLKLPLPNKTLTGEIMSERIVDVLSQNAGLVTHSDELFNSCLRAAAVLMCEIGDSGFKSLSKERVEALVSISCKCMESGGLQARSAALALLKATVSSRIMIPAVYDAIEKVNEMAIHCQSSSLRSSCTALSVQFAVSFPLGSRRVRQHLEFFVRNLNYELSSGRLAALEVIKAIILKFPPEILGDECQYLFVALTASVARDSHSECRSCASHALQLLFERVPTGRSISNLIKMASRLAGVKSEMTTLDEEIKVAPFVDDGVQLSGAFALMAACKSGRITGIQLNLIVRVLITALTERHDAVQWETTYALLQGLEIAFDLQKGVTKSERLEGQRQTRILWEAISSLLLHQHPWIRLSSARLLGAHLSVHGNQNAITQKRPNIQFSLLWDSASLVRVTLKSCCAQLEAVRVSEDLGQQCLKNLLCMANIMFRNPALGDLASEEDLVTDRKRVRKTEASTFSSFQSKNHGLHWLLCRMSGLALRAGDEPADMFRRGCALRFLLVTTQWWGFDFVTLHKRLYIAPVAKILEQRDAVKISPGTQQRVREMNASKDHGIGRDGLKEIASTLQDALVKGLGGVSYYEAFQVLRNERANTKEARKRQAAFELAVNPERAAKRRRKKAEARRNRRTMKVDTSGGDKRETGNASRNPESSLIQDL